MNPIKRNGQISITFIRHLVERQLQQVDTFLVPVRIKYIVSVFVLVMHIIIRSDRISSVYHC